MTDDRPVSDDELSRVLAVLSLQRVDRQSLAATLDHTSTLARDVIPADLPSELSDQIRALAVAAFAAVDCAGMARVDFLLDGESGSLFLNEVNTIPGFTTISMYSKMWAASGLAYPALIDRLIALAIERHADKQQLRTSM